LSFSVENDRALGSCGKKAKREGDVEHGQKVVSGGGKARREELWRRAATVRGEEAAAGGDWGLAVRWGMCAMGCRAEIWLRRARKALRRIGGI
jgi:hypothetical protein